MKIIDGFFFCSAPGSEEEYYLVPEHTREDYMQWCQCEFFDGEWKKHYQHFKQHQITWPHQKYPMPEKVVVIAYIVKCPALLGDNKLAFGSPKELANYIGREAEDVIFGEYEKILAKDVQFNVEVAMLNLEDYEKLPHYA